MKPSQLKKIIKEIVCQIKLSEDENFKYRAPSKEAPFAVYGKGTATSWSSGWSYLGSAPSIENALELYPDATFIKLNAGEPNEKTVWTSKTGKLEEMKKSQLKSLIKAIVNESRIVENTQDPTKEEMMEYLENLYSGLLDKPSFKDSAEIAIYWFANFNHGGQSSNLYSVLSTSPYTPSRMEREPKDVEKDMYNALAQKFGGEELFEGFRKSFGDGDQKIYKDREGGRDVYWIDDKDSGGKIHINPESVQKYLSRGYRIIDMTVNEEGQPRVKNIRKISSKQKFDNISEDEMTDDSDYSKNPIKYGTGPKGAYGLPLHKKSGGLSRNQERKLRKNRPQDFDKERIFRGIDKGTLKEDDIPQQSLIDGQSNNVAASRVNKILAMSSKGLFSDNSWEAINNIFKKLKEAGLDVELLSTKYGGHEDTSNGMPKYKEWKISIPFTNKNGKPVRLVGQITAHGAGSVEQPLDKYDITAYVSPMAVK